MDPLLIASGALTILQQVLPAIEEGVRAGQISIEQQNRVVKKIDLLRAGDFSAPEWQVE